MARVEIKAVFQFTNEQTVKLEEAMRSRGYKTRNEFVKDATLQRIREITGYDSRKYADERLKKLLHE